MSGNVDLGTGTLVYQALEGKKGDLLVAIRELRKNLGVVLQRIFVAQGALRKVPDDLVQIRADIGASEETGGVSEIDCSENKPSLFRNYIKIYES